VAGPVARRLHRAAIATLSFGLVAAFVASAWVGRGPSLEDWTARLAPPGARVLLAETRDGHHYLFYRVAGPTLHLAVVHRPHPFSDSSSTHASLRLGSGGREIPGNSWRGRVLPEAETIEFRVDPGFEGELHVSTTEIVVAFLGDDAVERAFVVPWRTGR
jgi:hypothetical protein